MTQTHRLGCACGQVQLQVEGAPIVSVECCCDSCRAAGDRLQTLPTARPVMEPHGTTRFVLYRKDRVRFIEHAGRLKEFRLTPESKTRRVVATCCNTPVFLEFENGHWLSLYGCLWPEGTLPPLEMRTMTGDLPAGTTLPGEVPNGKWQQVSFFARLLGAWIRMGFRSPKVAVVNGQLHV
ncbi:hypothetical protein A176_000729 [Myxococcus hansupus]|uniref:CENP-V/GFA domain-containing protein n=1 Tax=Pseudomyxococcus hansupus TaxID=1297742 RepID=A0A0H4X7G6_9BACT|nr:hypothetical protein [Myxococcus hansupus]AKQ63817.1 hypothetical protein A176_000729 [Myxococcus hansupus]